MSPTVRLTWVAIAILFVDLVFFSGASNFLASPQSRILNQVFILGALVAAGFAVVRGRLDLRSPVVAPGAAWVGATALSAATSQRPAASFEALALLLLAAPAYFVVRAALAHPMLRVRIDWLVIASTTVFVIAYLGQALTQWISWWSVAGPSIPPLRPGDVGLTVGTVNAVALYLLLLAPIAVWLSWRRWRSRAFSVGLLLLSAFALLMTGSRGAWLGAAAGGLVLAALVWQATGRPRPRFGRSPGVAPLVLLVGVAVVAVVLTPVLLPRLLSGDAGRFELWSAAWSMFLDSPIVGVGPGSWPGLRPLTPISDPIFAVLATSHSSVLHLLAETGVLGLASAIWFTATVLRMGVGVIKNGTRGEVRIGAAVGVASLVASATHSLVDSQIHIPAIVLLTLHLVARLELAIGPPVGGPRTSRRAAGARAALMGAAVAIAAVMLVPIDIAMTRASLGNAALDRGDVAGARSDFDAAVALHDLPVYRLGQALARSRAGDRTGAGESLAIMERSEPFTFVIVQRAALAMEPEPLLALADQFGDYDPTAEVNAAALRYPRDPDAATRDLAAAMARVPPLVYSARPAALFDDAAWRVAQGVAIERIGVADPVTAAAVAILAGLPDDAETQEARLREGPETVALALLGDAAAGHSDVDAAQALLRAEPDSLGVQNVLWMLGFKAGSQPLLDAVKAVAVPLNFNVPLPPMELVLEGRIDADYSVRLPRWPMAASGRNGPKRPYIDGFVTIEPVFRPGR